MTRLVLVRHGHSRATEDQVVGGPRGCTGLTERGAAQVARLRDRWHSSGELAADVLLSSILPRARETAEILAPALDVPPAIEDCDLCELHPGECDGMPWEEFEAFDLMADPERPLSPGGESLRAFERRVAAALDRLRAEHEGKTVVVATHGGVVMMSLVVLLGIPRPGTGAFLDPDNASVTEWTHDGRWSLVRYNDTAHLAGLVG